jgi:hypothetical protein
VSNFGENEVSNMEVYNVSAKKSNNKRVMIFRAKKSSDSVAQFQFQNNIEADRTTRTTYGSPVIKKKKTIKVASDSDSPEKPIVNK